MTRTRILGVHGVGNYQAGLDPVAASGLLTRRWSTALHRNLSMPTGLDMSVAYYAHRLSQDIAQGDEDLAHLPEPVQRDIIRWAQFLGAPDETPQGRITAPVRAFVEWVSARFGLDSRLARKFITTFFREVHTYFDDTPRRTSAIQDVADAVERHRPSVILAHSLGSVVTYEALTTHPHPDVDLLITLGSPLAMPDIVLDRLRAPTACPPGVAQWINIADPGDIIAVPRNGISRSFSGVTADITDSIHSFDFHRATHYLQCGATTGALAARVNNGP
nr:hypothetical protein [Kibdelosporangium sp. MJ126-NF4]CEL15646.1 hypothetical protein [Kibdelosporangium sp. MJ126-NF4]CTQ90315.1 hypothetical protein [Kibdelosporangium sp. MJ126-NF4]